MASRDSDATAQDKVAALQSVRRSLAAEAEARAALEAAQDRTAAALSVARMAKVPWDALRSETGLTRPALLARIARFERGGASSSQFAVSSTVTAPTSVRDIDDGAGAPPEVWQAPEVQGSVEKALAWVHMTTREQMGPEADPQAVLEACRRATERGGRAALAAVRELVDGLPDVPARQVSVVAAQAAAAEAQGRGRGDQN